jgi:hypothetical protein
LAKERRIKREDLLIATEKELEKIKQQTTRERRKLKGNDRIAIKVGKVINHYKMEKHFTIEISEDSFSYSLLSAHVTTVLRSHLLIICIS